MYLKNLSLTLYEGEDQQEALECVNEYRMKGRSTHAKATSTASSLNNSEDIVRSIENNASRTAHNIALRFKDRSAKFSGSIEENWKHYLSLNVNLDVRTC